MKKQLVLTFILCAAAALSALDYDDSAHLLERTGFGAPPRAVAELAPLSRKEAVERILGSLRTEPPSAPPQWASPPYPKPPSD